MITERGLDLLVQIFDGKVECRTAFDCLTSSNLFERAIGFEVFTGAFLGKLMPHIPKETDVPMLLLEYLLSCISADIAPAEYEQCDGYVHSKGEAFHELRVPLADYWEKYDRLLSEERYFERLTVFFRDEADTHYGELVTHTLEAWSPRQKPFSKIMRAWKDDPKLSGYVIELEEIFQHTF